MFAFSGDIHRVATFTHVSSLTVVVGIFSCTGGQKWEQLRGWQRALRQDRHVQQADRRCLRGEAHLRNISVNL